MKARLPLRLGVGLAILCLAAAQESDKALRNPFTSDLDIAAGEKLFRGQCASCHGYDARGGASGPDISTGNYRRASSDEGLFQLINKGIPGTTMPAFPLNARPAWQVVAYLRSLGSARSNQSSGGDAGRGRDAFARLGCGGCHTSGAADLERIGTRRTLAELRESILDPQADVPSQYWRMTAVTHAGARVTGARLNEDTFTVQMLDDSGRLRSFPKSDLKAIEIDRKSPMPSYRDKLSDGDLRDLLAFLVSTPPKGGSQ
jgi:putative heme-binding domain-containing protein